jgi:hypothetical protein
MLKTMTMKKKIALGVLMLAALAGGAFAAGGINAARGDGYPAPELYSPASQEIDLSGKETLQFKWRRTDQGNTSHYEFRLYKGYGTPSQGLILKRDINRDEYPFELPAADFEINQDYSWSLRQVYADGAKGDLASSSFRIAKKEGASAAVSADKGGENAGVKV